MAAFKTLSLPNTSVKVFMGKLWLHNSHAKLLASHVKEQHVLCLVMVHPKPISLHS